MFFVDLGKQYPGLQEYSRYIYMKQYVTDQAKIISKSVTKIYLINPWLKMTHVTFFLPVFTHNGTPIGILQIFHSLIKVCHFVGKLEHKTSFLWVLVDLVKCPLMEAKNYEK